MTTKCSAYWLHSTVGDRQIKIALRWLFIIVLCGTSLPAQAQDRAKRVDSISGVIRNSEATPLAGARVLVTTQPIPRTLETTTDGIGRFRVIVVDGTVSYLLVVQLNGHTTIRMPVRIPDSAAHIALTITLTANGSATLAPVRVSATRPRAPRTLGFDPTPYDSDVNATSLGAIAGVVSPDAERSVSALTGTTVGVFANGSLGAFGLSPDQTTVTLNGMAINAQLVLPTGLATRAQVNTASSDGGLGGYTGANVNVNVLRGTTYHYARGTAFLDGSMLQPWGDPSRRYGTNANSMVIALSGQGPVGNTPWRYNGAVDISRASAENVTLGTASSAVLSTLGIQPDSIKRLNDVLATVGIVASGRGPAVRATSSVNALVRLDRLALDNGMQSAARTWSMIASAQGTETDPQGAVSHAWSAGRSSTRTAGQIIGRMSQYVGAGKRVLSETQLSASLSTSRSRGVLEGPSVRVRINSPVEVGTISRVLAVGGDGAGRSVATAGDIEMRSLLAWKIGAARLDHVTVQLFGRAELARESAFPYRYGSFDFESLDALAAADPTRFRRSLSAHSGSANRMSGGSSASATYWATRKLVLRPSVRLEGERFLYVPQGNPDVDRVFQVRTRQLPQGIGLIPRIGFTYYDLPDSRFDDGMRGPNAFVPVNEGPGWQFPGIERAWRGSVGLQRGVIPLSVASTVNDGPVNAQPLTLECGPGSVPPIVWSQWFTSPSDVPSACTSASGVMAGGVPNIRVFSPRYSPPSVWSVSLIRSRPVPQLNLGFALSAQQRFGTHSPSSIDRNLVGAPVFFDAQGRAVFVPVAAIDSTSGTALLSASRNVGSFGRVVEMQSGSRSRLTVLGIQAMPLWDVQSNHRLALIVSYAWQQGMQTTDGTQVAGFGDTRRAGWSRIPVSRHQVGVQVGKQLKGVVLSGQLQLRSGVPFTPIVGRDVNADGYLNDLARIPAGTDTFNGGANMHALLMSAPAPIRTCLSEQSGRVAAPMSCTGAWTVRTNARLQLLRPLGFGNRELAVSLNFDNLAAGIDNLIHGSRGVRGWGAATSADPILLHVTRFSAVDHTFGYAVNPRFGQSGSRTTGVVAPFRISINVSVDLAQPVAVQQLRDAITVRERGTRTAAPASIIAARVRAVYAQNPYASILSDDDSLDLTAGQDSVLQHSQRAFIDSSEVLVQQLVNQLSALNAHFSGRRSLEERDAKVRALHALADRQWMLIDRVLTDQQFARLRESARDAIRRSRSPPAGCDGA